MTKVARAALAAALALAACDDDAATEVIVTIRAQEAVEEMLAKLVIDIKGQSDEAPAAGHAEVSSPLPYVIMLRPKDGDAKRTYRVTATAYAENNVFIAEARLVSGFVSGQRRYVVMELEDKCVNVAACDGDDDTCHAAREASEGACVSAKVDADDFGQSEDEAPRVGDLIDERGAEPEPDGGAAGDGMVPGGGTGGAGAAGRAGRGSGGTMVPQGGAGSGEGGDGGGGEAGEPAVCDADPLSCSAALQTLVITSSVGDLLLDTQFDPDDEKYALGVPLVADGFDIVATAADERAQITIDDETVTSGESWHVERPPVGRSTLVIVVSNDMTTRSYTLELTRGTQETFLKANDNMEDVYLGQSVAASGDMLVAGRPSSGARPGAAFRFMRGAQGRWTPVEPPLLGQSADSNDDQFGYSVAIAGNTTVVGAPGVNMSAGAVYVFGDLPIREIVSPQAREDARFGASVAIAGDTIAIGATGDRSVELFVRAGAGAAWTWQATLRADDPAMQAFGTSVALGDNGNLLAVGDPREDSGGAQDSGAAFVYRRADEEWSRKGPLKSDSVAAGQQFGYSVAIADATLVVGMRGADDNGGVTVFRYAEPDWILDHVLQASAPGTGFGASVALAGDVLVIGAPLDASAEAGVHPMRVDSQMTVFASAGAAYLFVRGAQGFVENAYLKPSNPGTDDEFGHSVAIGNGLIAVGALYEDSDHLGVGTGEVGNDGRDNSGAVYVFR